MQTAVEDAFRTFGQSINRALENESEDAFVSKSQRRLNLAKVRKGLKFFENASERMGIASKINLFAYVSAFSAS